MASDSSHLHPQLVPEGDHIIRLKWTHKDVNNTRTKAVQQVIFPFAWRQWEPIYR